MAFTKITAAGIGSTETVTLDGLSVINNGSFGGNLTVGGVLTYEDVTNVDSVGLITARNGIVVGSGITLSKDGDIFATGITTVSGNVKVGTGITISPDGDVFATGVTTTGSLVSSGAVSGTTGTFTGNVAVSGANITLQDSGGASDDRIVLGAGSDLSMYDDGRHSRIVDSGTGNLILQTSKININNADGTEGIIHGTAGGAVEIYHANVKKIETTANGVKLPDNSRVDFGDDSDLQISYSSSSNTNEVASDKSTNFRGKNLYFYVNHNNSSESAIMAYANAAVDLYYDSSKKFETTNTGAQITGDLAFPSGNGISFAATSDGGTMASELLDDYEEGTFTPRLGPNVSMSTIHENGLGRYTKIGNMVTCTMHWIAKDGTAFPTNETIRIDTLPYTIKHVGSNTSAHYVAMSQMMYNVQFGQQDKHYFYSSHNQTYLTGLKSRDGTSWQDWSTSDWNQNNLYFNTSITYMTT